MSTHYRLRSAVQVGDSLRTAGSTITAEEFATIAESSRTLLLNDEHVAPCDEPATKPTEIKSPFPRKRDKIKEADK